jgi:redox-sensing transcriptional repressor
MNTGISDITLRRIPRYLNYIKQLKGEGRSHVSASRIGEILGVHHTQVRKDLALAGLVGIPKVGHKIDDMIPVLETFLNWDNISDAFLVGAGNLGAAIMGYDGFHKTGIKIVAAFDTDVRKIGKTISGTEVLPISKFPSLAERMHIHIGVITTPAEAAQEIADMMAESGILAIWNFAPIKLRTPEDMIVEDVNLYSSLAVLSKKLKQKIQINI